MVCEKAKRKPENPGNESVKIGLRNKNLKLKPSSWRVAFFAWLAEQKLMSQKRAARTLEELETFSSWKATKDD